RQTLLQASAATAICVLLGLPGACVLYRRRFPGRDLLRAVVTVPFVLPSVVVGIAFHALVTRGGPLGGVADGAVVEDPINERPPYPEHAVQLIFSHT
nr:hypothetical protein [Streptococcus anginosus]